MCFHSVSKRTKNRVTLYVCIDGRMRRKDSRFLPSVHGKLLPQSQSTNTAIGNDSYRYVTLLKACSKKKDLREGIRLHREILESRAGGLQLAINPHLANTLISMYAKCEAISMAEQVVDDLPCPDIVSWNALISGYVQQGKDNEVLQCFECIHNEGHFLDVVTLTCVLKVCGRRRQTWGLKKGKHIHSMIVSRELLLEKDIALGSALVNMYAKCGKFVEAQEVFDELLVRNTVSWNVLISGYVVHGVGMKAMGSFEVMLCEGLSPDTVTYVCILKICGIMQDLVKGKQIHYRITQENLLGKDIVLGNALIDMYAKCGELQRAQQVMEKIPDRDAISWSTLIARYAELGQHEEALKSFENMLNEGHSPDVVTFISILKACTSAGAIDKGKEIHDEVTRRGWLEKNIVLGNTLVDMYAKCGMLAKAKQVLERLPVRDIVSWNVLIAGYAQQGEVQGAVISFQKLKDEGLSPDAITFVCMLQACGISGAVDKGKQIHEEIIRRGLGKDLVIGTALIDMYAKCGVLKRAQEILEELPIRDLVSWSAVIEGYVHQGGGLEALNCYKQLENEGLSLDAVVFISILKACGKLGALEKGERFHKEIMKMGSHEKNTMIGNVLMDMYVKCGELSKAQEVLECLPVRDVVSWNTVINGYARQGKSHEALICFDQMQREGIFPDAVTFVCILNACGAMINADNGKEIHDQIMRKGLLVENDSILTNSLVNMYAKCSSLAMARDLFEDLPLIRSIVSWNTLIIGHTEHGQGHQALNYFEQMRSEGLLPNAITFTCVLKACGIIGHIDKAKYIHNEIVSSGFLENSILLGNALVDMYAKCGMLEKAHQVLQELSIRNVVSWSTLMSGCLQQDQGEAALNCFRSMQNDGLSPDVVTLTCILKACGCTGAIVKGKQIHEEIVINGLFGKDIVLCNALVDMYTKCGLLAKAKKVIEEDHLPNIISWNTLISGYAKQRQAHEALKSFVSMESKGLCPDEVTLLCLLSACGHSGLLDEAQMLYENMTNMYGIIPDLQHHTCMVSCFGRFGHINEATSMIKRMSFCVNDSSVWLALLGACREWGSLKLGRLCFDQILQLKDGCATG